MSWVVEILRSRIVLPASLVLLAVIPALANAQDGGAVTRESNAGLDRGAGLLTRSRNTGR